MTDIYTGPTLDDRNRPIDEWGPGPKRDLAPASENEDARVDTLVAIFNDDRVWSKDVSAFAMRTWILEQMGIIKPARKPAAKKPTKKPAKRGAWGDR